MKDNLLYCKTYFLEEYTVEEAKQFLIEKGIDPDDYKISTHELWDGTPVTVCTEKRFEDEEV